MSDRIARVLVVDDDPNVRDILDRFLTERGYSVESADDGEEALRFIESYGPDVVLLDIRMPKMDGVACLERIVDDGLDCGVIMISGEADVDVARETLAKGAADFIYKPFNLGYLESSLMGKLLAMGRA